MDCVTETGRAHCQHFKIEILFERRKTDRKEKEEVRGKKRKQHLTNG